LPPEFVTAPLIVKFWEPEKVVVPVMKVELLMVRAPPDACNDAPPIENAPLAKPPLLELASWTTPPLLMTVLPAEEFEPAKMSVEVLDRLVLPE
jgi:hypothetical protein